MFWGIFFQLLKWANLIESQQDFVDFHIWDGAFSPGYGKLSDKAGDALNMMARKEGFILDPVYTAKSFAAIPGLLTEGLIPSGSRVLFIHTGGLGAFFAYQKDLLAYFKA